MDDTHNIQIILIVMILVFVITNFFILTKRK